MAMFLISEWDSYAKIFGKVDTLTIQNPVNVFKNGEHVYI